MLAWETAWRKTFKAWNITRIQIIHGYFKLLIQTVMWNRIIT